MFERTRRLSTKDRTRGLKPRYATPTIPERMHNTKRAENKQIIFILKVLNPFVLIRKAITFEKYSSENQRENQGKGS